MTKETVNDGAAEVPAMMPSELQLWADCPFVVPAGLSVHKYVHNGEEFVAVRSNFSESREWSATCRAFDADDETIGVMVNNVIGAAFEQRFPGRYMKLIHEQFDGAMAGADLMVIDQDFMLRELAA